MIFDSLVFTWLSECWHYFDKSFRTRKSTRIWALSWLNSTGLLVSCEQHRVFDFTQWSVYLCVSLTICAQNNLISGPIPIIFGLEGSNWFWWVRYWRNNCHIGEWINKISLHKYVGNCKWYTIDILLGTIFCIKINILDHFQNFARHFCR